MSVLHVHQIKAHLNDLFTALIDMSDCQDCLPEIHNAKFATRALAAYVTMNLGRATENEAAYAVTDGSQDGGIDAIFYSVSDQRLIIVQSKWHERGNGTIDRGDMLKTIEGVEHLISLDWDYFNDKIKAKSDEITKALNNTRTHITIVIAYTGNEPISNEIKSDVESYIKRVNDTTESFDYRVIKQTDVYGWLSQQAAGDPVNTDIVLYQWAKMKEPILALYGQVAAQDVAEWMRQFGDRLLTPNLRMFLRDTEVNLGIQETLLKSPELFWYFNNGITILSSSIKKKPIGGETTESGTFECLDVHIVNGAQTAGSITAMADKNPTVLAKARVSLRLISLENCPDNFASDVARTNNTQNRIDKRDFVSQDPQQERLRHELQLDKIQYAYKSGDDVSTPESGFNLEEATVALACAKADVALTVQAKREIGILWKDIAKAPYISLFNPSVTGAWLWNLVRIVRLIDESLKTVAEGVGYSSNREKMIPVHGNRLIAHLVMQDLLNEIENYSTDEEGKFRTLVQGSVWTAYASLVDIIKEKYQESYLATLFKNASKCKEIKDTYLQRKESPEQTQMSLD